MESNEISNSFLDKLKNKHIVYFGLFVTLIAAFFSDGFYHLDENYQIFEFASYKLGNIEVSEMPWEFKEQMRPTLQPMLVVWMHDFLDLMGLANPFAIATFFRLLVGAGSIYVTVLLYRAFAPKFASPNEQKIFLISSIFLWFAVYNHVRFSSETCSALLLFGSIALVEKARTWNLLLGLKIGVLLGFSFLFRFQIAFGIVGLGFYLVFIQKIQFKYLLTVALGFLALIGFGTVLDSYFFGQFVFTPWNYFAQNILEGKAAEFSVDPWWEYFRRFFETGFMPIAILIFIGLFFYFKRAYNGVLFCVFISFLFFHILISHKEIRFLFPMITVLPFGVAALYNEIQSRGWLKKIWVSIIWKLIIVFNFCLVLYVTFIPANSIIQPYRYVYNNIEGPVKLYCYSSNYDYLFKNSLSYYCASETKTEYINSLQFVESEVGIKNYVLIKAKDVNELSIPFLGELMYTTVPSYLKWVYDFEIQSNTNEYRIYSLK